MPRLAMVGSIALLGLAARGPAQSLERLRQLLREIAIDARLPAFLSSLADLAEESELSGGRLRLTDGTPDTTLRTLSLPVRHDVGGAGGRPDLRIEATFGQAGARIDVPDIWGGLLVGSETRVTARYVAYGADLGLGPSFDLGAGLRLQPLAHAGISYVDSKAVYRGPGAPLTSSLADGILFNWDGVFASYGGSLGLCSGDFALGPVDSSALVRYDVRHTEDVHVDDPAQHAADTTQWITVHWGFEAPTPWGPPNEPLRWQADVGYKRFVGGHADVVGFDDYVQLGAGVRWNCGSRLPLGKAVVLNGSLFVGDDVLGWNLAASLRF